MSRSSETIHVFLGTKAQYIKTAPVLRALEERGVSYRLIDSGQHGEFSVRLRRDLDVRQPDVVLGRGQDVESIPQAVRWALGLGARLWSRRWLAEEVFGGQEGICVVHGDTPSTLLSTLMARRVGLQVAHLEAGLRSHQLLHPFPEELIRLIVMRMSDVLYAPDTVAVQNLDDMGVRGDIVHVDGNTVLEALLHSSRDREQTTRGPVVMTMHRVENLHRASRVRGFVRLAVRCASDFDVRVVMHGPTEESLRRGGHVETLTEAGVELTRLVTHEEFTAMLGAAPFVVTDGGSIQEECALLGVPTLLWRDRTERPDGLATNVVLSRYRLDVVDEFLSSYEQLRHPPADLVQRPSYQIVDDLVSRLSEPT